MDMQIIYFDDKTEIIKNVKKIRTDKGYLIVKYKKGKIKITEYLDPNAMKTFRLIGGKSR